MGLLGEIFSASDSLKRRVKGLLSDPIGYLQQLDDQAKNYNNNVRPVISGGLLDNRPLTEKEKQQQAMELVMNLAPIGMTVWHGSPHKFTKFDMSKIGTGEGAQAYGHGLYTAESKNVGSEYRYKLSAKGDFPNVNYKGEYYASGNPELSGTKGEAVGLIAEALRKDRPVAEAIQVAQDIAKKRFANDVRNVRSAGMGVDDFLQSPESYKSLLREIKGIDPSLIQRVGDPKEAGYLYKVDIPDEAVARMLDWDKKLSEQTPEVRQAITKLARSNEEVMTALQNGGMGDMKGNILYSNLQDIFTRNAKRNAVIGGEDAAKWTHDDISRMANGNDAFATQQLKQYGIPGIRYLDGGSRGVGEGTSNFVLFDDAMPRILEINGQATGTAPWKPGEWRGLLSP